MICNIFMEALLLFINNWHKTYWYKLLIRSSARKKKTFLYICHHKQPEFAGSLQKWRKKWNDARLDNNSQKRLAEEIMSSSSWLCVRRVLSHTFKASRLKQSCSPPHIQAPPGYHRDEPLSHSADWGTCQHHTAQCPDTGRHEIQEGGFHG